MPDPILLPHRGPLTVEENKIKGYLLNPLSKDGAPKARFFLAHGFTPEAWIVLATALQAHGTTRPVIEQRQSPFGTKYALNCQLATPDGRNPCITTVWIVEGHNAPRLVTAYPAPQGR